MILIPFLKNTLDHCTIDTTYNGIIGLLWTYKNENNINKMYENRILMQNFKYDFYNLFKDIEYLEEGLPQVNEELDNFFIGQFLNYKTELSLKLKINNDFIPNYDEFNNKESLKDFIEYLKFLNLKNEYLLKLKDEFQRNSDEINKDKSGYAINAIHELINKCNIELLNLHNIFITQNAKKKKKTKKNMERLKTKIINENLKLGHLLSQQKLDEQKQVEYLENIQIINFLTSEINNIFHPLKNIYKSIIV